MEASTETNNGDSRRARRRKDFPVTPFSEAAALAETILREGVERQLRRLMVFDRMGRKPDSGKSRQLITDSGKYGLTVGGYSAEYLKVTDDAVELLNADSDHGARVRKEFEMSVQRVPAFNSLYERLKNSRVPAMDVLADMLEPVPLEDRRRCADVFLDNAAEIGLIRQYSGENRLVPIEQVLEELPGEPQTGDSPPDPNTGPHDESVGRKQPPQLQHPQGPTLHVDVNIHIDASASGEQIAAIFSNMAKYLYRYDEEAGE